MSRKRQVRYVLVVREDGRYRRREVSAAEGGSFIARAPATAEAAVVKITNGKPVVTSAVGMPLESIAGRPTGGTVAHQRTGTATRYRDGRGAAEWRRGFLQAATSPSSSSSSPAPVGSGVRSLPSCLSRRRRLDGQVFTFEVYYRVDSDGAAAARAAARRYAAHVRTGGKFARVLRFGRRGRNSTGGYAVFVR